MSDDVNSRHFNPDDYQASAPFKGGKPKEVKGGIDKENIEAALDKLHSKDRLYIPMPYPPEETWAHKLYMGPKYEVDFNKIEYPRYHINMMNKPGGASAVFYVDRDLKPIDEIQPTWTLKK